MLGIRNHPHITEPPDEIRFEDTLLPRGVENDSEFHGKRGFTSDVCQKHGDFLGNDRRERIGVESFVAERCVVFSLAAHGLTSTSFRSGRIFKKRGVVLLSLVALDAQDQLHREEIPYNRCEACNGSLRTQN